MRKKLVFIGSTLLLIFLVLAGIGYTYETVSYKNIKANYPPDGLMIDVGDREIHVNVKGEKSDLPPVIIETGTGNWSYDWYHIQEELSEQTKVLTYDRSGYGWSSPPSNGFSLEETISDLHTILEVVEMETPFIFIGHSVGGVYARHFIDKYPDKVAGLILVDSRNEFFDESAPSAYNNRFFESEDQSFNKLLAQFGVIRLVGARTLNGLPDFMSEEKYAHVQYDVPFFKVLEEEIQQISSNVELLDELRPLNDKPLTVITPNEADSQAIELGFSKEQADEVDQIWKDSQEKLTELSTNSQLIYVPNSSHAVMYDQPEVLL